MRTPTYEAAITFITLQDERARSRLQNVQALEREPTIRLVSDLFDKPITQVVNDCVLYSHVTLEAIDEA